MPGLSFVPAWENTPGNKDQRRVHIEGPGSLPDS